MPSKKEPPTLPWPAAYSEKDYVWPVVELPNATIVHELGAFITASGGHHLEESHADRGQLMEFPNPSVPDTKARKRVTRCECRRRALVTLPPIPRAGKRSNEGAIKVCAVCDAVDLWPQYA